MSTPMSIPAARQGHRLLRPVRTLAVGIVAVLLGGLALAPVANAALPPRDRVYASYLPTVHQVGTLYPELVGGSRSVHRYLGQGADFSCWDWTDGFRAADGRWSMYYLPDGTMPYFSGLEDPGVFVFKFHTRDQAMTAFWMQMRFVRECMGKRMRSGTVSLRWPVGVPGVGQAAVAYRVYATFPTADGRGHTRELHVSAIRGRYLVNVFDQAKEFQPSRVNAVRLARITVRNIG